MHISLCFCTAKLRLSAINAKFIGKKPLINAQLSKESSNFANKFAKYIV